MSAAAAPPVICMTKCFSKSQTAFPSYQHLQIKFLLLNCKQKERERERLKAKKDAEHVFKRKNLLNFCIFACQRLVTIRKNESKILSEKESRICRQNIRQGQQQDWDLTLVSCCQSSLPKLYT